ncbi:unnamed protein product [Didymodactylos carnosus]|uniref:Uncharacterized protein n=1 Tax=Didymodactylos carnosus TaxID=1234261 RepID=A0A8S2FTK4_9BILA|nr:unnamed protein product [Didymodactylos carnosus]CAF4346136.1 unnamed protein product [Didymodactylos carnosus]
MNRTRCKSHQRRGVNKKKQHRTSSACSRISERQIDTTDSVDRAMSPMSLDQSREAKVTSISHEQIE